MDQASHHAWAALAEKALKGAPLDTLRTPFADGFTMEPLYGPAAPVYSGRPDTGPWRVVQRIDHAIDPAAVTAELVNGADALSLVFAGASDAFGSGLTITTTSGLDTLLKDVLLDHCPVYLSAGPRGAGAAAVFCALLGGRSTPPREVHLGLDPFGSALATGELVEMPIAEAVRAADSEAINGTVCLADGRPVAEAGGTPAEELALALAAFAEFMTTLTDGGIDASAAARRISLALSASQDQFTTIAKLRAARRLHAMVTDAFGANAPLDLQVTTLARMLSHSDVTTNLLRLTIATFSAGVGGADAVTVLPYAPDGRNLAARMSRNIQRLLIEESHLAAIADPAAGAGAIEALTDELAAVAWAKFQTLTATGLAESLKAGTVQAEIAASAAAELAAVTAGQRTVVGVTKFPPPNDQSATPITASLSESSANGPSDPTFHGLIMAAAGGGNLSDLNQSATLVNALPPVRLSAAEEDAR